MYSKGYIWYTKKNMDKKILIVEDDRAEANVLVDKFTQEGFLVSTAENGKKGLERALLDHPDLILLDIIMPEMDGLSMLNELRKDEWGKAVPVIILTNLNPDDEIVRQKGVMDFAYFLIKSNWKLDDVVRAVKKELKIA